jgi:hypothetical protein
MNKDKFFYNQICIDFIPFNLYELINVFHITKWAEFLHKINFKDIKDVYSYLDKEINELKTKTK